MSHGGNKDTIAAIATAPGEAGIAIVRVAGPESYRVADAVFRGDGPPPSQRPGGTFVHGHVIEAGELIDEVILLIMRAPHSYTGEDTVEIQGHGGSVSAQRVLRRVLQAGARLAEPGEFTKRAFLNGRMDLTQAEAVLDLIRARSDRAARSALEQLEGGLSRRLNPVYDQILHLAADLEASLDFPEDELPPSVLPDLRNRLRAAQLELSRIRETSTEGRLLREGARVVIAGRPNAGKSTLLNALLGTDRSIVSHHPGTTRDTIEEQIVLNGIPISLVDTAGLRDSTCDVELEGIRRTINILQKADAYLYVVDGSQACHEEDRIRLESLPAERCLVIKNKADLGDRWESNGRRHPTLSTALLQETGLDEVKCRLTALISNDTSLQDSSHSVVSERHTSMLDIAVESLRVTESQLGLDESCDLAASSLRDALEALGRITGRVYETELLDSIFSRFCIGK